MRIVKNIIYDKLSQVMVKIFIRLCVLYFY